MPEFERPVVPAAPIELCSAEALQDNGHAFVFDVLLWGAPQRAFALRFESRVVAYVNRCAHVPVEMDWQPGEFLDAERRFIVCAIHGATYDPANGRCVNGPCGRARLMAIDVVEQAGRLYWYPCADIQPMGSPGCDSDHAPEPFIRRSDNDR